MHPGFGRAAVATAMLACDVAQASADVQAAQNAADEASEDEYATAPVFVPYVPPPPADEADHRVERTPTRFDLGSAYSAVAQVDVGACKADGLAAGYGRVVLGFESDGAPTGVALELPAGSAPASRACVEQAFRRVRVAPFDGTAVSVRRSFYVKA